MTNFDYDDEFIVMQREYLAEQTDTMDDIESLFLFIESNPDDKNKMRELKRIVHSFKGASGSYDFQFLPIACHYIEDKFDQMRGSQKYDFSLFFKIIDLMKEYIQTFFEPGFSEKKIIEKFNILKGDVAKKVPVGEKQDSIASIRILVLESTNTLSKAYRYLFGEMNIEYVSVNSGMDALALLLREKYDVLITGTATGLLDGQSLIAVCKIITGPSANVFTILTTSSGNLALDDINCPNKIIIKDESLLNNLKKTIGTIDKSIRNNGETEISADTKINKIQNKKQIVDKKTIQIKKESIHNEIDLTSTIDAEDVVPVCIPERILVIDDDESVRNLINLSFKKHEDVEVGFAASYEEGMERLSSFVPDLILLDFMLGERTGEEFIAELRKKITVEIPVVFLTGLSGPEEVAKLLSEKGCIGVLTKPFVPKKLYKQVISLYDSEI